MPLYQPICKPGGIRVPVDWQASEPGDEGRSSKSGPEKVAGASLSLVHGTDLRIQQDAARLLGSA